MPELQMRKPNEEDVSAEKVDSTADSDEKCDEHEPCPYAISVCMECCHFDEARFDEDMDTYERGKRVTGKVKPHVAIDGWIIKVTDATITVQFDDEESPTNYNRDTCSDQISITNTFDVLLIEERKRMQVNLKGSMYHGKIGIAGYKEELGHKRTVIEIPVSLENPSGPAIRRPFNPDVLIEVDLDDTSDGDGNEVARVYQELNPDVLIEVDDATSDGESNEDGNNSGNTCCGKTCNRCCPLWTRCAHVDASDGWLAKTYKTTRGILGTIVFCIPRGFVVGCKAVTDCVGCTAKAADARWKCTAKAADACPCLKRCQKKISSLTDCKCVHEHNGSKWKAALSCCLKYTDSDACRCAVTPWIVTLPPVSVFLMSSIVYGHTVVNWINNHTALYKEHLKYAKYIYDMIPGVTVMEATYTNDNYEPFWKYMGYRQWTNGWEYQYDIPHNATPEFNVDYLNLTRKVALINLQGMMESIYTANEHGMYLCREFHAFNTESCRSYSFERQTSVEENVKAIKAIAKFIEETYPGTEIQIQAHSTGNAFLFKAMTDPEIRKLVTSNVAVSAFASLPNAIRDLIKMTTDKKWGEWIWRWIGPAVKTLLSLNFSEMDNVKAIEEIPKILEEIHDNLYDMPKIALVRALLDTVVDPKQQLQLKELLEGKNVELFDIPLDEDHMFFDLVTKKLFREKYNELMGYHQFNMDPDGMEDNFNAAFSSAIDAINPEWYKKDTRLGQQLWKSLWTKMFDVALEFDRSDPTITVLKENGAFYKGELESFVSSHESDYGAFHRGYIPVVWGSLRTFAGEVIQDLQTFMTIYKEKVLEREQCRNLGIPMAGYNFTMQGDEQLMDLFFDMLQGAMDNGFFEYQTIYLRMVWHSNGLRDNSLSSTTMLNYLENYTNP